LELTWNGTKPIQFDNGIQRTFIEDGDEIILRGSCQTINEQGQVIRLGFGDCAGVILPSK
jgi:fumarylacetoacetase